MIKIYLVISAALILILNNFFNILQEPYSWWLVPVLLIGFVLCFVIIQMLIFLFAILAGNTNKSADKGDRFFRFMVKISLPIIIALARVQIRTEGTEKLPENKHMMFVCNHQHDFDPVIMLSTFPHADLAFIGKKEIYVTMPLVAKIMHRLHSLPIDRENDREAAKTIIQAIKLIKDDVVSIYVRTNGVAAEKISEVFGTVEYLSRENQPAGELAFVAPAMKEKLFDEKLAQLGGEVLGTIRVLELE